MCASHTANILLDFMQKSNNTKRNEPEKVAVTQRSLHYGQVSFKQCYPVKQRKQRPSVKQHRGYSKQWQKISPVE